MRWLPTVAMMFVSLLSYVDRNSLAILSPTILKDTGLSATEYGWIITAFSVAYTIANPVWGRLLDRLGLFIGMLAAVALWTTASALHALCGGLLGFALARAALGFGEGATFPGGLRTVTQTLPPAQRSRGTALAYSGGSLGAMLTPLFVTPLANEVGWRGAFLATGVLGAAWLVLWGGIGRTLPPMQRPQTAPPRLCEREVCSFMVAYALGGLPLGFVIYAAPIYLHRALGASQEWLGHWLWLPPLGWELGYFFWGYLADRGLRAERAFAFLGLASLPLAAVPLVHSAPLALAELVFAMFIAAGFVIFALTCATRRYSTEHSGFIAGLCAGGWSALVGVLMPLFGWLFDHAQYQAAFALSALVPGLGTLGWHRLARRDR